MRGHLLYGQILKKDTEDMLIMMMLVLTIDAKSLTSVERL